MVKRSQFITYQTDANVENAFLFNCRRRDLFDGPGILAGTVVQGQHGFVAAESNVPNIGGNTVAFVPNGQCQWKGQSMPCLYLSGTPKGTELICLNYIVAEVPNAEVQALLQSVGIPVVLTPDGKKVVNLECDRFTKQSNERRARLISPEPVA